MRIFRHPLPTFAGLGQSCRAPSFPDLQGAEVRTESSAEAAWGATAENDFDLIISHIGMPTMSGYEFIERVRRPRHNPTVPAIALTGFGREQDAMQALDAGSNAHRGNLSGFLHC